MGFDLPPENPNKRVEVQIPSQSRESLSFGAIFGEKPVVFKSAVEISNVGQIDHLQLPPGFETASSQNGRDSHNGKDTGVVGTSSRREFRQHDNPDFRICLEYRGLNISEKAAEKFHQLLSVPAHSLTEAELADIRQVLGKKSDSSLFQLSRAATEDLNGKRVLVIDGKYPEHDLASRTIFVDADDHGSAVQEVSFEASENNYTRFQADGFSALRSITWK